MTRAWGHLKVLDKLTKKGDSVTIDLGVSDLSRLFPSFERWSYARYDGSLTTPPCTPDVIWLVLESPVMVSAQNVKKFTDIFTNARPLRTDNTSTIRMSPNGNWSSSTECWKPYSGYRGVPYTC